MTDLEELIKTAESVAMMQNLGMIRDMTEAEKQRMKEQFPDADMILGNFIIKKRANGEPK